MVLALPFHTQVHVGKGDTGLDRRGRVITKCFGLQVVRADCTEEGISAGSEQFGPEQPKHGEGKCAQTHTEEMHEEVLVKVLVKGNPWMWQELGADDRSRWEDRPEERPESGHT